MRKILILLGLVPLMITAQSKKEDINLLYSALTIPDSIKKNAHIVLRLDEAELDIISRSKYNFKVHQIITILDKEGALRLRQVYGIDKFYKIDDVEIKHFNLLGIEKRRYKKRDFTVTAAYDGISLVTDDKVMRLEIAESDFPCTLEIEFTQQVSSFINLPQWYFQTSGESVQCSRFTVKVPTSMSIRYKPKNINISPVISAQNSKTIYLWETSNLMAKKKEVGGNSTSTLPYLLLASNQFEYDGYEGEFKDWQSFGNWCYPLYKESKNPFSEARRQEIQRMVAGARSTREKISILYESLQKNMRYVSIQLGIGGFKPFSVSFVDEKKYGDCKALTNYMRYMLEEVGIKSYPALVKSQYDAEQLDPDFPINRFDHVILCVPEKNDTVWLECTSKTNDFGNLGNFTENKFALLITENGGVLVSTPQSKSAHNIFLARTEVRLEENGIGEASFILKTEGEYKSEAIHYFVQEKKDNQKYYLINGIGLKPPDEFELNSETLADQSTTKIVLLYEKIPEFVAGNKMFMNPRLYRIFSSKLPAAEGRTTDFLFECPFEKSDTTVFKLPESYGVDVLPKEKQLKFEFGSYTTRHWYDEQQKAVVTTARLVLTRHRIPAVKYAETKKFFDEVIEDGNQKLVIKKL